VAAGDLDDVGGTFGHQVVDQSLAGAEDRHRFFIGEGRSVDRRQCLGQRLDRDLVPWPSGGD
jgi:hypothetical protein